MDEPKIKVEVDEIVKVELDTSGPTESPQNSDEKDEPKVKVEVDNDIKVEPDSDNELEPSVVASNEQEVLSELSNGVPDNGEGVGKLMRQFKEELQPENDGGLDSNTINESEMTIGDPRPVEGLHASTSQRKVNVTSVECETLGATKEGGGNTGDSFNFTYWKLKAEEQANLKMKSDKNAHDLETKLLIQKLESDKKIWDLEGDLAYWKGKAKELERKFLEEVKRAESDRLPDHLSDAAKCLVIAVQSTSTGSSVKSDFFPASSIPSMDESSDKGGRKNGNDSFSVIDAGRKLEVGESSPASPCLVEMTKDRSAELNSAQIIGTREDRPCRENSFSSLRSATSPEIETGVNVTSCGPKPGKDHQITSYSSDSSMGDVKIAECENVSPAGRLSKYKGDEKRGNAHDSTDVKTSTSPPPSINLKTGKYKCGACSAEFSYKSAYQRHYKSGHLKVRFKCVTCGKQFSHRSSYVRHKKSTHLKERITCDTCGMQFTDRGHFNRHQRGVHAGIRYACQICKKSFSQSGDVRKHQRTTDCGKKLGLSSASKHACHLCAKLFYNKYDLKVHRDGVHYKLGEYSCNSCGKKYNTKHSLNRHRRKVHNLNGEKGSRNASLCSNDDEVTPIRTC